MLEKLLGNDAVKRELAAALREGRLSHCVLLCGEEGTGANFAARCLAADYLYPDGGDGARLVLRGESAEVLCVQGEGVSGEIRTERVREVRRAVFETALSAHGRCVLIRSAQKLNAGSANALLKVLEEPPEGVLFILTADSEAAVLPTVRSRCAVYSLSPVARAVCEQQAAQLFPGAARAEVQELCALFGGKLGCVQRCLAQPEAMQQLKDAKQLAQCAGRADRYGALCVLSGYEKDRLTARALLQDTRQICAAALRGDTALLNAAAAAAFLPQLAQAESRLAANGNQKLVLTALGMAAG